jgi:hypothetical protein
MGNIKKYNQYNTVSKLINLKNKIIVINFNIQIIIFYILILFT